MSTSPPQSAVNGPRIQLSNGQVERFGESDIIPQGRVQNTFQYTDILSWVRGAHNGGALVADELRYSPTSH